MSRLFVAIAALAAVCHAAANQPLDVPFFHQQTNGCGAASVAMVLHYWDKQEAPERVYQQLYKSAQKGILLSDMKRYLEESGFRAFTLRGEWNDVEQHLAKGRPIIVGLKKNRAARIHFAVVIGADHDHVWLNDPTRKKPSRVNRAGFQKQWTMAERWMLLSTPAAAN